MWYCSVYLRWYHRFAYCAHIFWCAQVRRHFYTDWLSYPSSHNNYIRTCQQKKSQIWPISSLPLQEPNILKAEVRDSQSNTGRNSTNFIESLYTHTCSMATETSSLTRMNDAETQDPTTTNKTKLHIPNKQWKLRYTAGQAGTLWPWI